MKKSLVFVELDIVPPNHQVIGSVTTIISFHMEGPMGKANGLSVDSPR